MTMETEIRTSAAFYAALPQEAWARSWPVVPVLVTECPVKRTLTEEEKAALWLSSGMAPKGTARALSQTGVIKSWTSEDDRRVRLKRWKQFHRRR